MLNLERKFKKKKTIKVFTYLLVAVCWPIRSIRRNFVGKYVMYSVVIMHR